MNDIAPIAPAWPERRRRELHDELHARPALAAVAPCMVSYWVHWGMRATLAEAALTALCQACGQEAPAPGERHHVLRAPTFELRYERHGEFISWQVSCALQAPPAGTPELPWLLQQPGAMGLLPASFMQKLREADAGEMLAATHVVLLKGQGEDWVAGCREAMAANAPVDDGGTPLIGSRIADGKAVMFTQLRLDAGGFTRFALLDLGMPSDQASREAQRLCEIEAYRMLAMLGFPVAQKEAAGLGKIEQALQATVDDMADEKTRDDARAFDTLTHLAAEAEHIAARTRYRFSATRAYHQIVQRRLADLREVRLEGVRTLGGFLNRRFTPAVALCESTDTRLTDIADRINRAVNLARVRLEMHREENNQKLLMLLAARADMQLRLQQTVEGLSVVAISYYLLGLVNFLAKAAKDAFGASGWQVQPDLVVGLAVVPVVLGVAWFIRRLRRHLGH